MGENDLFGNLPGPAAAWPTDTDGWARLRALLRDQIELLVTNIVRTASADAKVYGLRPGPNTGSFPARRIRAMVGGSPPGVGE
jgi:hypothetical protein